MNKSYPVPIFSNNSQVSSGSSAVMKSNTSRGILAADQLRVALPGEDDIYIYNKKKNLQKKGKKKKKKKKK